MEQPLMPETIHRHSAPTSLDEAPYGTLCKVDLGKEIEVYAQVGKNETRWYYLGSFTHC